MPWAAVAGAAVSVIGGALVGDHGAGDANAASASATNQQAAIAQDQWDTYKQTYQPLEKAYVAAAQNYDTPQAYEKAAGLASSTTSEQFGKARERLMRTPGIDPSSGAFTSAMAGLDRNQAAVDAVGQNAARKGVADTAWARKTDALSLGKGLPAQASTGLASVASASSRAAQLGLAQQGAESGALGRLVSQGVNAYMKPTPGLTDAQTTWSNNYTPENYG